MCCAAYAVVASSLGCAPADFDRQVGRAEEGCAADSAICPPQRGATSPAIDAGVQQSDGATPADAGVFDLDSRAPDAAPADGEQPTDARASLPPDDGATHGSSRDAGQDAGSASDAAADSSAPSCGNVLSDPMNCGACGTVCSASAAQVSCMNGSCVRSCQSGRDDCDRDLVHGLAGNGCETPVEADPDNCGLCRRRCVPPADGFAGCEAQKCVGYTLVSGASKTGPLHGNELGGVYFGNLCAPGEVVTGIGGRGEATAVWAVRAKCARLRVTRSGERLAVSTVATTPTSQAGSGGLGAPVEFDCPANMVITSISGSTILYSGTSAPSIRSLTVGCSAIQADVKRIVSLVAGPTHTIGMDTTEVFSETCGPNGVLVGFRGHEGDWLDGLRSECAPLEFDDGLVDSVMIPHDASP